MIVLGLGSNLGDRAAHLWAAVVLLGQQPLAVRAVAPLYESPALLPEGAPDTWNRPYLNSAVAIETTLEPVALLPLLKCIELHVGRTSGKPRWAPREIDIDILVWHDRVVKLDILVVPHQGLELRRFALLPLLDLLPDFRHPVLQQTGADLLKLLPDDGTRPYRAQDAAASTLSMSDDSLDR